jgi:type I restriction-modification system DNA methylase subunit
MVDQNEQEFLNNLEKKLWISANKLLPSLDAAQYKHVMLGLVFLKYVSDAFDIRREELKAQLSNPDHDYFLDPADFEGGAARRGISGGNRQRTRGARLLPRNQYLLGATRRALAVHARQ